MIPRHQRECFVGTLGVQLGQLALAVQSVGGHGVTGGAQRKATGLKGGGSRPRVDITRAMVTRIRARKGKVYAESQSVLSRELGLSVSMVKDVRGGGRGVNCA